MKNNKNLFLTAVALIGIIIIGAVIYSAITKAEEDTPPSLSLAPGSTFKGMFTDPAKYWQYEEGDTCTHDVSLTSSTLKQGQHIYYSTEDLTFQDILDRINCVPFNRIRILYPDPETNIFHSFPEAYYQNTTTVSDPSSVTIKAFNGFVIESSKETLIGGINAENEPVDVAPLLASNPNAVSDIYGWLVDIEGGWVLIPRAIDSDDTTADEYERIGEFLLALAFITDGRLEKAFIQMQGGDYNFELAWEMDEVAGPQNYIDPEISENDVNYMVWVKLAEAEVVTVEDSCGGASAEYPYYACITDGSDPAQVIQNGNDACAGISETCYGVQVSCHNIEGQPSEPDWSDSSATCESTHFKSDCAYRAVCSSLELAPVGVIEGTILLPEEELPKENFCSSSDEDANYKCVSTTGNETCSNIGRTCIKVGTKDQNNQSSEYEYSFSGGGCDRTVDSIYESFVKGYDWSIRAFCAPCGFADDTHACITGPTYNAQSDGITTGDAACQYMGLQCVSLEYFAPNTGLPGGVYNWYDLEGMACHDQIPDDPQTYIPYANQHVVYSVRAECQ